MYFVSKVVPIARIPNPDESFLKTQRSGNLSGTKNIETLVNLEIRNKKAKGERLHSFLTLGFVFS